MVDNTLAAPNTAVCPVCSGMPGTLPVVNQAAVEYAIRVALALECEVQHTSIFARKNYFYPDLPKGYQISQYEIRWRSTASSPSAPPKASRSSACAVCTWKRIPAS